MQDIFLTRNYHLLGFPNQNWTLWILPTDQVAALMGKSELTDSRVQELDPDIYTQVRDVTTNLDISS